jgi:transcription elongation GreA/GreB family factor
MNKKLLFELVLSSLDDIYQGAIAAAARAHATATNKESVAENKYDTFGLEASYLAQGQSQRVEQCKIDLAKFQQLVTLLEATSSLGASEVVGLGSVVVLCDNNDKESYFLISPSAGGLSVQFEQQQITCITPLSPIGQAMLGQQVDGEFEFKVAQQHRVYEIIALY